MVRIEKEWQVLHFPVLWFSWYLYVCTGAHVCIGVCAHVHMGVSACVCMCTWRSEATSDIVSQTQSAFFFSLSRWGQLTSELQGSCHLCHLCFPECHQKTALPTFFFFFFWHGRWNETQVLMLAWKGTLPTEAAPQTHYRYLLEKWKVD